MKELVFIRIKRKTIDRAVMELVDVSMQFIILLS